MRDRLSVVIAGPVAESRPGLVDLVAPEAQRRGALLTRDEPAHGLTIVAQRPVEREGLPDDLGVERTREPAVAGQREDRNRPLLSPLEQRQAVDGRSGARRADHQLHHPVGVRAHRLDSRLRAPQPSGGDELHRLRDLARVPDRPDAPTEVLNGRQTSDTLSAYSSHQSSAFQVGPAFVGLSRMPWTLLV